MRSKNNLTDNYNKLESSFMFFLALLSVNVSVSLSHNIILNQSNAGTRWCCCCLSSVIPQVFSQYYGWRHLLVILITKKANLGGVMPGNRTPAHSHRGISSRCATTTPQLTPSHYGGIKTMYEWLIGFRYHSLGKRQIRLSPQFPQRRKLSFSHHNLTSQICQFIKLQAVTQSSKEPL